MGRLVRDAQREPVMLACRGEVVAVVVGAAEWRGILGELRALGSTVTPFKDWDLNGPAPAARTLECPCCGGDTFEANDEGLFHDGQVPTCGCPAWISCDAETDPFAAWDDSKDCVACAARERDNPRGVEKWTEKK